MTLLLRQSQISSKQDTSHVYESCLIHDPLIERHHTRRYYRELQIRYTDLCSAISAYLSRIAEVDHKFDSIIELNSSALLVAEACDIKRASSHYTPPLHGLPILLKDEHPNLTTQIQRVAPLPLWTPNQRKKPQ